MPKRQKRQAEYIFVNPNTPKDIEAALRGIILEKLLNRKFSFQQQIKTRETVYSSLNNKSV